MNLVVLTLIESKYVCICVCMCVYIISVTWSLCILLHNNQLSDVFCFGKSECILYCRAM